MQSTISTGDEKGNQYTFPHTLIKSNILHQLSCPDEQLLLLFYPTSTIGHYLNQSPVNSISTFNHFITNKLQQHALAFIDNKLSLQATIKAISDSLQILACECEKGNHFGDKRIETALNYLEKNYEKIIPVKEIAAKCFLSESRFLHLFKEKTGFTYRKVQQWHKVSQSFTMLSKQSLTTTAYQFGFSDSAHYTKVFKETFGFSPNAIKKNS